MSINQDLSGFLPASAGDVGSIPGSGRSPGEGNGNPFQYSCLGNPIDRGAWWATVHGVTKSWTWFSHRATTTVKERSFSTCHLKICPIWVDSESSPAFLEHLVSWNTDYLERSTPFIFILPLTYTLPKLVHPIACLQVPPLAFAHCALQVAAHLSTDRWGCTGNSTLRYCTIRGDQLEE